MTIRRNIDYHSRTLEEAWREAADQFPALLLTGPRQVGKTSLLEHLRAENRAYVTLDDMNLRALARSDPPLFLQQFSPPVLIDEVQYAPELFPAIKQAVDRHPVPGSVWLTGSQSFPLMKGISESLAGRVAILNLLGFSAREADRRPSDLPPFLPGGGAVAARKSSPAPTTLAAVYERIWRGSFPALVTGRVRDRDLFYRSYVQTYLQRDVRDLLKVGDLDCFMRFLKATAARTGQLLNYSDFARDCGISVNTARNWLAVLQASHQVFLLPAWHSNLSKRLYTTPKLHFLDTGLCAYLTEWSSPATLAAGAMSGAILESHVIAEILKSWWHRGKDPALYHYRDKDGREIDLLIAHDGHLYPVEIKRAALVRAHDLAAFRLLERRGAEAGAGAVLSLSSEGFALDRTTENLPIGWL
ncbi:MAG: ATP-binding protein [Verrucomicrobia bacterium]|nr:ATP-binding protein [Verrucomicrobiota bacterium]